MLFTFNSAIVFNRSTALNFLTLTHVFSLFEWNVCFPLLDHIVYFQKLIQCFLSYNCYKLNSKLDDNNCKRDPIFFFFILYIYSTLSVRPRFIFPNPPDSLKWGFRSHKEEISHGSAGPMLKSRVYAHSIETRSSAPTAVILRQRGQREDNICSLAWGTSVVSLLLTL